MVNGAQIHLALNHLPVVGVMLGILVLMMGYFIKNLVIKRNGLAILIFSALTIVPAYLSGEPAEKIVEHKVGVTEALIHAHEEAAELSLIFTAIVGSLAALSLWMGKMKRDQFEVKGTHLVLAFSVVNFALLANTAHLGGLIRHDELRSVTSQNIQDHDDD